MVHMVIHVTERLGYSLHQAAGVVALLTVMQATGQLSGGWLGDRFSSAGSAPAACSATPPR